MLIGMFAPAARVFNLDTKVAAKVVAAVLVLSAAAETTVEGAAAVKVALVLARLPAATAILLDTPLTYVVLSLVAQPLPDWTCLQPVEELALYIPVEELGVFVAVVVRVHSVVTLQFALLAIVQTAAAVAELAYAHAYVMPALVVGAMVVWVTSAKVSVCTTVAVVTTGVVPPPPAAQSAIVPQPSFFACSMAFLAAVAMSWISTVDLSVQTQGVAAAHAA